MKIFNLIFNLTYSFSTMRTPERKKRKRKKLISPTHLDQNIYFLNNTTGENIVTFCVSDPDLNFNFISYILWTIIGNHSNSALNYL